MIPSREFLYTLIGLLFLFICLLTLYSGNVTSHSFVFHANSAVVPSHIEVVDTPELRQRGLGGVKQIPDDYGMLFVFSEKERYGFWMKDMLAPIDMVWLSDNGTIVTLEERVPPETYPHVFYPSLAVKYVLETSAGYALRHEWKVGTNIGSVLKNIQSVSE